MRWRFKTFLEKLKGNHQGLNRTEWLNKSLNKKRKKKTKKDMRRKGTQSSQKLKEIIQKKHQG